MESSELERLEEVLRARLPGSSLLHNCVLLQQGRDGVERQFYLNTGWTEDRLVLVCLDSSEAAMAKLLLYTEPLDLAGLAELLGPWVSGRQWSCTVLLGGLGPSHTAVLGRLLDRQVAWQAECREFYLLDMGQEGDMDQGQGKKGDLDSEDWNIDFLGQDHVDLVLSTWKYSDKGVASGMLSSLMERKRVQGVFPAASLQPAAWVTLYSYGTLGMLHTRQEFRRKGLASKLMVAAGRRVREEWDLTPLVHIKEYNTASQTLFTSLGYIKGRPAIWTAFPEPSS